MYTYLETHLALISANLIFQEKDARFKTNSQFPGRDGKRCHWTGKRRLLDETPTSRKDAQKAVFFPTWALVGDNSKDQVYT